MGEWNTETHGPLPSELGGQYQVVSPQPLPASPGLAPAGRGWLTGSGAPPSGSGLDPLDGVHDPWRWSPDWAAWFGPAYRVHAAPGDVVALPPGGVASNSGSSPTALVVMTDLTMAALLDGGHGLLAVDGDVHAVYTQAYADDGSTTVLTVPAGGGGDGVAMLLERDRSGGPHQPPEPDLDVRDFLGDLAVGAPFQFEEGVPVGKPGQFWLDVDSGDVYLRADGGWAKVTTWPLA